MPLTVADLKVGLRVRCLGLHDQPLGTIREINYDGGYYKDLRVEFDNNPERLCLWWTLDYFEKVEDHSPQPNIEKKACNHCGCYNELEVNSCWFCKENPHAI